ncbi:hypothetical protein D3C76_920760 [compost metagenome]
MRFSKHGLISFCLMMCAACVSVPPSSERQSIVLGCPAVTRCALSATSPLTNSDQLRDIEQVEAAWHDCAAQVDMVYDYQQRHLERGAAAR